jgi:hypothetical protein
MYILLFFPTVVNHFFILFSKNSIFISPNVPAVYDVLTARIRACEARPGLAKCGGVLAWE